jgi:hypothetical protein
VRPVEVAFGGVHAGLRQRRAQIFQVDAVGREGRGVGLNADGGLLSAADAHSTHAAELRDLRRQARVDEILDLGERQGIRRDAEVSTGASAGFVLL